MKILIIGVTGGIGHAIKEILKGHKITGYSHFEKTFVPLQPFDWIIFAQGVIDEHDVDDMFRVNTIAPIEITKNFLPFISPHGGIIYISSTAAITANSKFPAYSASKAALNCYTKAMAKQYTNFRFYAVCPGPTNTKLWKGLNIDGVPQEPEEVAKVVHRILEGEFKSGDIITVRNGEVTA